jgi:hypothetical protein
MYIAGLGILSEALTDPGHGSIHGKKLEQVFVPNLITIQTKHSTLLRIPLPMGTMPLVKKY